MKKIIWRKIISRGLHPVLMMEMVLKGLNFCFKQELRFGFNIQFYKRYFGATFMEEHEWQKINKSIEKKYKNLERILINSAKTHGKLINFTQKLNKQDFSKKTGQELKLIFKKTIEKFSAAWAYCYIPWNVEEILMTRIEKNLASDKDLSQDCLVALTLPALKSKVSKERRALILLALKYNKLSPNQLQKAILRHQRKFFWVNTYLMRMREYPIGQILKNVQDFHRKNPLRIIKAGTEKEKQEKMTAQKIINQIVDQKNGKKLVSLIKTFKRFALWRTTKIEDLSLSYFYAKPLFDEMAKRLSLDYNDFIELKIGEILTQKFSRKEIKRRQKGYVLLMEKDKIKFLTGPKAISFLKEGGQKKEEKRAKILQGKATFQEKVSGRVQVLFPYQYHKLLANRILVTPMTTPDITSHLRKIKAIIADEGGLFSHAAILAREFNIPAVLGTKIATKVLRNNDLVEIDGRNGTIKVLAKK